MPSLAQSEQFNIAAVAVWASPNLTVSVNGRTAVTAATPSTLYAYGIAIENDGAILLTYQETEGGALYQRRSRDGGRTWA